MTEIQTVQITQVYANDDTGLVRVLRAEAAKALHLRTSIDLVAIVQAYGDALGLIRRDAENRGYYYIDSDAAMDFIRKHPISCLYGERISTLTRTGGLENVDNTSLSDVYNDSLEAVKKMVDGERIQWYVPGCIEPGTPEWTTQFTSVCE